jgi:hypothetical protein
MKRLFFFKDPALLTDLCFAKSGSEFCGFFKAKLRNEPGFKIKFKYGCFKGPGFKSQYARTALHQLIVFVVRTITDFN